MEALEGRTYGPYPLRVCAEKVSDFVAATSDDPDRWTAVAPPGWAAAALFVVAPESPDATLISGEAGIAVIHGEQRFDVGPPAPDRSRSERHRRRHQGAGTRRSLLHHLRVRGG